MSSPTTPRRTRKDSKVNFQLPPLITAIKEGWQLTGENGAIVSSLLAGVAAQLLGFFKSTDSYQHAGNGLQRFIVVSCYWAMIFNIGAAISSFVMMDYLGEVPYYAAKNPDTKENPEAALPEIGRVPGTANHLLQRYSGSPGIWFCISLHWLTCLFLGILTLIMAIMAYVWAEEVLWMKLTTLGATMWIVIPPFILVAWQRRN
ncbi:hypothetical protein DFP72DRAFT_539831 [Ephemerocybe angulata]|uniref:Uncharacterized protein n=1 Tax=Ephemerocybe angulata TaxID=980116 RepID=A0A8H6HMY8_9AGAR|nr:hypothetical protein DFP72DRAFT_539831 [Tulosesus angulatus]